MGAQLHANPSPNAIRKRSQRVQPRLTRCEECGATANLQRHHPDLRGRPAVVVILCQPCHTNADMALGKWGPGPRRIKRCVICGEIIKSPTHSRVKTCGGECLSEAGRRAQAKRKTNGNRYTKSILNPTDPAIPPAETL